MSNKVFYGLMAALTLGMIALALVWPQGLGSRSPAPFGHAIIEPDVVRMEREKAVRDAHHKAEQVTKAQTKARERAEREEAAREAGEPLPKK
jgi:hypothetical protein